MDLIQMRYFVRVYQEKKIAAAAERLYVSQQYLSKVIHRIEEELGATLFVRTQKGLIPTAEGERAYARFQAMLEAYGQLQEELCGAREKRCRGRVRMVLDVGLMQLLTSRPMLSFSRRYPDVELVLEEHRVFNCKKLVLQGRADAGLSLCTAPGDGLEYRPLCEIGAEVLVASDRALARCRHVTLEDLAAEKLLFQSCPSYYTFLEEFERAGMHPDILLSINEEQTVLDYVKNGMGVCPTVIRPGRGARQCPRGITAVPFAGVNRILLCGYVDPARKDGSAARLVLDYLTGYFA